MKKLKKSALGLTKAGAITGIGTEVVSKAGGETGGLTQLSRAYPRVGIVMGAGHTLRILKKELKVKRRRRKRKK